MGAIETCRRCYVKLPNITDHLKINKECGKFYFIEERNGQRIEVQQENMLFIANDLF